MPWRKFFMARSWNLLRSGSEFAVFSVLHWTNMQRSDYIFFVYIAVQRSVLQRCNADCKLFVVLYLCDVQ